MTNCCDPIKSDVIAFEAKDCETLLAEAMAAYHVLMLGQSTVKIKYKDSEVNYSQANKADLKSYIDLLNSKCGNKTTSLTQPRPRARSLKFGSCGGGCS